MHYHFPFQGGIPQCNYRAGGQGSNELGERWYKNYKTVLPQERCPTLTSSETLSPRKRIQLRSECISQLDRLHALMEKGGISQDQYEKLSSVTYLGNCKVIMIFTYMYLQHCNGWISHAGDMPL